MSIALSGRTDALSDGDVEARLVELGIAGDLEHADQVLYMLWLCLELSPFANEDLEQLPRFVASDLERG